MPMKAPFASFALGENVTGIYPETGEKIDRPRMRPDGWQGTWSLPFTIGKCNKSIFW